VQAAAAPTGPAGLTIRKTHVLYVPSQSASFYLWDLIPNPDQNKSDMRYLKGNPARRARPGRLSQPHD